MAGEANNPATMRRTPENPVEDGQQTDLRQPTEEVTGKDTPPTADETARKVLQPGSGRAAG